MQVGEIHYEIMCESYWGRNGIIQVRTLPCPAIPESLNVECSKRIRAEYPVGTKFMTKYVKICQKPDDILYARAKDQMIYPLKS